MKKCGGDWKAAGSAYNIFVCILTGPKPALAASSPVSIHTYMLYAYVFQPQGCLLEAFNTLKPPSKKRHGGC